MYGRKECIEYIFKCDDKGKCTGVCNVECLSVAIYKRFVKKNHKICNKYVEFFHHLKNLDRTSKPITKELTRLGFNDVNTAIANTAKTTENAPSTTLEKRDINTIVEKAMAKGTALVRYEMQTMETRLII